MTLCPPPFLGSIEREMLGPREELSVLDWSRRHLRITEGPLVGQQGTSTAWRPETFPPQRAVMEAVGDPRWSRVWLMASPQSFGKTECAALPPLLHAVEHRVASALYMASRLPLAITQWRKKILTAMLADADCAALIHTNPDYGGDKEERRFTNGTSMHFAGAESVGAISGFTAPVVVADDLQACPAALPGYGHPAELAFARAGSFPEELQTLVGLGTAGTVSDYLWLNLKKSALFMPFLPCPACGTYQLLEFNRLTYPDDPAAAVDQTWMKCAGPRCSHAIAFPELPAMLSRHLWVSCPPGEDWVTRPPDGGTVIDPATADVYPNSKRNTREAGFWASALYWPLGQTWGQRAAEWIGCRGDPDREKDYQQRVRNVPWAEPDPDENALTVEDLASHQVGGYKKGEVPEGVTHLTMSADVHDRFIYYIVRGWKMVDGTSWLIDAGTLGVHGPKKLASLSEAQRQAAVALATADALAELWKMNQTGWPGKNGEIFHCTKVAIDGGYRTELVGKFCRARNAGVPRTWEMVRGLSSQQPVPIWPKIPKPSTKYGIFYREIGVNEAKLLLRDLLAIPPGQPGYWHEYVDANLDAYHRHLVGEHLVVRIVKGAERAIWEKRPNSGPIHWWDCEVYSLAAAIGMGVKLAPFRGAAAAPAAGNQQSAVSGQPAAAGSWFAQRKRK